MLLLHNPHDEREEKNTERWQKSANNYSPNNYPVAFFVLNKACKTLITPTVVQYAAVKLAQVKTWSCFQLNAYWRTFGGLFDCRPDKDVSTSIYAIFFKATCFQKRDPVAFSPATAEQRREEVPPGSFAECALNVRCLYSSLTDVTLMSALTFCMAGKQLYIEQNLNDSNILLYLHFQENPVTRFQL